MEAVRLLKQYAVYLGEGVFEMFYNPPEDSIVNIAKRKEITSVPKLSYISPFTNTIPISNLDIYDKRNKRLSLISNQNIVGPLFDMKVGSVKIDSEVKVNSKNSNLLMSFCSNLSVSSSS